MICEVFVIIFDRYTDHVTTKPWTSTKSAGIPSVTLIRAQGFLIMLGVKVRLQ